MPCYNIIYVNNTLPLALAVHERSGQEIAEWGFEMLGEPTTNIQVDFKSNNALDTQRRQFKTHAGSAQLRRQPNYLFENA